MLLFTSTRCGVVCGRSTTNERTNETMSKHTSHNCPRRSIIFANQSKKKKKSQWWYHPPNNARKMMVVDEERPLLQTLIGTEDNYYGTTPATRSSRSSTSSSTSSTMGDEAWGGPPPPHTDVVLESSHNHAASSSRWLPCSAAEYHPKGAVLYLSWLLLLIVAILWYGTWTITTSSRAPPSASAIRDVLCFVPFWPRCPHSY